MGSGGRYVDMGTPHGSDTVQDTSALYATFLLDIMRVTLPYFLRISAD
jgi:hypothetical protein